MTEETKKPDGTQRTRLLLMIAAIAAYVALNIVLILRHEPWRDEAQAWLMAKDLSPWQLLMQISNEGHPVLWHLILMPFAKLGFPFQTIHYISLAITTAAGCILLMKAPFPAILRVLLLFSPAFVYYYPVISRSYCLIALLVILLAAVYPARQEKPLRFGIVVALLVQTHVIMAGFCACLCAAWLIESAGGAVRKKAAFHWKSALSALGLPLVSALSLAYLLLRNVNTNVIRVKNPPRFQDALSLMANTFTGSFSNSDGYAGGFVEQALPFLLVALLVFALIFSKIRWAAVVAAGGILFEYVIYAFIYEHSVQKLLSISFILIWFVWTSVPFIEKKRGKVIFVLGLCVFCLCYPIRYVFDLRADYIRPYSNSTATAAFIRETVPPDAIILAPNTACASSVLVQLPEEYDFYNPFSRSRQTYMTWEAQERYISFESVLGWIDEAFPDKKVYMIVDGYERVSGLWDHAQRFSVVYKSPQPALEEFENYMVLYIFH